MSNITTFKFKSQDVRTLLDEKNNPWFVAKDVCDVLGTRTDTIPSILDNDEFSKVSPNTIGVGINAPHGMTIVSQSGLFALLFKSRKSIAKEFKRWVTHEVLPSIFRTGSYSVQPQPQPKTQPTTRRLNVRVNPLKSGGVSINIRIPDGLENVPNLEIPIPPMVSVSPTPNPQPLPPLPPDPDPKKTALLKQFDTEKFRKLIEKIIIFLRECNGHATRREVVNKFRWCMTQRELDVVIQSPHFIVLGTPPIQEIYLR